MYKHLFFDDTRLLGRDNLKRIYGTPQLCGTFADPRVICGYGWAWAIKGHDGKISLLYQGLLDDTGRMVACLSSSDDGLNFQPVDVPDDAKPAECALLNQIDIPLPAQSEIGTVMKDPLASPDERYKLLMTDYSELEKTQRIRDYMLASPDLIHWKKLDDSCWNKIGTEPVTGAFFNTLTCQNTILSRPDWGQRRVAITETTDWHTYSPMEMCMQADSIDPPLAEMYGMNAWEYDGWFIGMPLIYSGFPPSLEHKFHGGTMQAQLAYSLNGRHWQRSLRSQFLGPDTTHEDGDWQMVFPTSLIRNNDGSLFVYAGCSRMPHGTQTEKLKGQYAIRIFRLRKDGFIALSNELSDKDATLALREAVWNGGSPVVNLSASFATCAVYDSTEGIKLVRSHEDCIPFSGDSVNWTPVWKTGNLDEFKNHTLIFELKFRNGTVFSFEYDAIPLMTTEGFRYKALNQLECQKGF